MDLVHRFFHAQNRRVAHSHVHRSETEAVSYNPNSRRRWLNGDHQQWFQDETKSTGGR